MAHPGGVAYIQPSTSNPGNFDANSNKYRTCFCHARSCALCWSMFQLSGVIIGMLFLIVFGIIFGSASTIFKLHSDQWFMTGNRSHDYWKYEEKKNDYTQTYLQTNKNESGFGRQDKEEGQQMIKQALNMAHMILLVCAMILAIELVIISLAVYGICRGRWKFVMPYFIFMIILLIFSAAMCIFNLIILFNPETSSKLRIFRMASYSKFPHYARGAIGQSIGSVFSSIGFSIFITWVFYHCILYLRAREAAIRCGELHPNCPVNPSMLQQPLMMVVYCAAESNEFQPLVKPPPPGLAPPPYAETMKA